MNEFDRQNDQLWRWGLVYYNPKDPSIWVEKRHGLGWTPNFAHRMAYVQIFLFLAVVIGATFLLIS